MVLREQGEARSTSPEGPATLAKELGAIRPPDEQPLVVRIPRIPFRAPRGGLVKIYYPANAVALALIGGGTGVMWLLDAVQHGTVRLVLLVVALLLAASVGVHVVFLLYALAVDIRWLRTQQQRKIEAQRENVLDDRPDQS